MQSGKTPHEPNPTLFLKHLPDEMLLHVADYLTCNEVLTLAVGDKGLYNLFKAEIGKEEANQAKHYVIFPTEENLSKLKTLLHACPVLLLQTVSVENRHQQTITGTIYQIALHEGDDELIHDLLKPAFHRLHHGLELMEAQRQAWLPEDWQAAEQTACTELFTRLENLFAELRAADKPEDVIAINLDHLAAVPEALIMITKQTLQQALDDYRAAVNALFTSPATIMQGRDFSLALLEKILAYQQQHFAAFGKPDRDGCDTPRNRAVLKLIYGYCQRFMPINFLQACAQGDYGLGFQRAKLIRSLSYNYSVQHNRGNQIFPLDFNPKFRLGYEFATLDTVHYFAISATNFYRILSEFLQPKAIIYSVDVLFASSKKQLREQVYGLTLQNAQLKNEIALLKAQQHTLTPSTANQTSSSHRFGYAKK